jgi:16S rRNA (cytidine1402-2'-O)-methyltransferase
MEGLVELIKKGNSAALISDCGTPLLADPGQKLIQRLISLNIPFSAIPGASALLTALVVSGFPMEKFFFRGYLSANSQKRIKELKELRNFPFTQVIYETPYRYKRVIIDMKKILGGNRNVFLGLNLTMKDEKCFREPLDKLCARLERLPKAEPVIIF